MTAKTPYFLGLTGSIGMGKTTASNIFRELGVAVWDADACVHRLYDVGGAAVEPLSRLVPDANKNGRIDRSALKAAIAEDTNILNLINTIVHPLVAQNRQEFIKNTPDQILVFDIPLLYETNAEKWLTAVAVVSTDAENQRQRVLARPGMTEEQFQFILQKQTPDALKRTKADFIIPSDTLEGAKAAILGILKKIRAEQDA